MTPESSASILPSRLGIIGILKLHEAGRKVPELAREIIVSAATIYTGKSRFGGTDGQRYADAETAGGREPALEAPGDCVGILKKVIVRTLLKAKP